ncbi:MAG: putative toxin-antitoxin system toxin component, PIN family [Deferrisomatales bacterium]
MGSRLVLDTNVLISVFQWRGPPFETLRKALRGEFQLLTSPALLEELDRVLRYPKFRAAENARSRFLLSITEAAELVHPEIRLSVVVDDPDDDRVLECAIAGAADFIVGGDPHLRDLKSFREIPVLSPADFLARFP